MTLREEKCHRVKERSAGQKPGLTQREEKCYRVKEKSDGQKFNLTLYVESGK